MNDLILRERVGYTAVLTLNRPQRHNSLVPDFLWAMLQALSEVAQDETVQAVALQANGRSFSTGGDVQGFYDHLDDIEPYAQEIVGLLNQVILAMMQLPVPIVTAVHGIITGGSLGLVLASDIVLVAPSASFTPYYSIVGFSPDGGWTAVLPHLIGQRRVAAVLMHNQTIDAETAVRWGLANRLVAADTIRAEALAAAQDLTAKKPASLRHVKQLLLDDLGDVAARLEAERAHFVRQIMTPEARRGILDFLKK